jgi:hypothetical protein
MKNILFLLTVVILLMTTPSAAQYNMRINWGEDPVNLEYNGTPGMITVKVLYSPIVSTQGKSGKWVKGIAGNGQVFDVDSISFFWKETITEGIAWICGNPTKFQNALDLSRVQLVKRTMVKGDKGDQGITGRDGKDGLDGKDGRDGKDGQKVESSSVWNYIVGGLLVVAGFVVYSFSQNEHHEKPAAAAPVPLPGTPPSGKTDPAF